MMFHKVIVYRIVDFINADPIRPELSQNGFVPCIGCVRSIAVQGTALDCFKVSLWKPNKTAFTDSYLL